MKCYFLFLLLILKIQFAQSSNNLTNTNFQIGIYGLQSSPGTYGFQTGSLNEIKDDIDLVKGTINAAIPYRHWDRVNYPNWDYNKYFQTYLQDMYSFTFNNENLECIQSYTPPLYSSFLKPPIESLPDDDRWNDRNLDFGLFQNFIKSVLEKELRLVINVSKNNKNLLEKILTTPNLHPLGGWYLDDEPLVRNHDIEVIETMSNLIRLIEKEFFYEKIVPLGIKEELLNNYLHPRYIAFDGDDLHKYFNSGRKFDGKFYNRDGNTIYFEKNQIYTVFKENTFDVLLLDFYHDDNKFWKKMFNDIADEYNSIGIKTPSIMPVFNIEVAKTSNISDNLIKMTSLLDLFKIFNVSGVWMYIWENVNSNNFSSVKLLEYNNKLLKEKLNYFNRKFY
jgi:hypothetical protein